MSNPWRFEVRLRSKEALRALMDLHQPPLSIRGLSEKCDPVRPDRFRTQIGHLLTKGPGGRDTCSAECAKRIQEVLGGGKVELFDPALYRVAGNDETSARRAA